MGRFLPESPTASLRAMRGAAQQFLQKLLSAAPTLETIHLRPG